MVLTRRESRDNIAGWPHQSANYVKHLIDTVARCPAKPRNPIVAGVRVSLTDNTSLTMLGAYRRVPLPDHFHANPGWTQIAPVPFSLHPKHRRLQRGTMGLPHISL